MSASTQQDAAGAAATGTTEAPLRALVVDDEAFARQRVRRLLEAESGVTVIGECSGGAEAIEAIGRDRPDVVFLDVQMPRVDGFEVLRRIDPETAPLVVFVTAFDEHALRAFDVHALDYLLKPVDVERLRLSLQRARLQLSQAAAAERHRRLLQALAPDLGAAGPSASGPEPDTGPAPSSGASPVPPAGAPGGDRLLVKEEGRMFFLKPAEIDWVEAYGNYARVHVGTRTHLVRETMTNMERWLEPFGFARIHRSSIVNLDRVKEMQSWFSGDYVVLMADGTRLKLSRWYRDRLEQRMRR